MPKVDRRDFLKAAGAITYLAAANAETPKITDAAYTPVADYPIRPTPYFDVTIADGFWKRKIDTNANVTIPLEVQKLIEGGRSRGLSGNVLEAAILALRTHVNPDLQRVVDARIDELKTERWSGNDRFEVAATYHTVTGRKELLDNASAAAARLYDDFVANDPPFPEASATRSTASSSIAPRARRSTSISRSTTSTSADSPRR